MIALPAGARILLATRPVDFRKGAHSLAENAAEAGKTSPALRDGQRKRRAGRGRLSVCPTASHTRTPAGTGIIRAAPTAPGAALSH